MTLKFVVALRLRQKKGNEAGNALRVNDDISEAVVGMLTHLC